MKRVFAPIQFAHVMEHINEAIEILEMAIVVTNNPEKYIINDETNLDTLEEVLELLKKVIE